MLKSSNNPPVSPRRSRRIGTAARQRGRRSAAEAGRTRQRILRRAQQLFARKGYGATSLRELSSASDVSMFTIHHHFGSKLGLYKEILDQWDRDVERKLSAVMDDAAEPEILVERVVDELFDFFLANRAQVVLNVRATLGEGLPRGATRSDHGWLRFAGSTMAKHKLGRPDMDVGLMLISVEGILHNQILALPRHKQLFGRDTTEAAAVARVKQHVKQVILTMVGRPPSAATARPGRARSKSRTVEYEEEKT